MWTDEALWMYKISQWDRIQGFLCLKKIESAKYKT